MKNLYKALADFQQEVPVIHKDTQGFNYSYADLPTIFQVINPLLKKHGLGFTQTFDSKDGVPVVVTILFHVESGEILSSELAVPQGVALNKMNDFQVLGSAITYLRRYAISSILGLVTDKDTDASGEQVKKEKPVVKIDSKTAFDNAKKAIDASTSLQELIHHGENIAKSVNLDAEQKEQLAFMANEKNLELKKVETINLD